jgi:DNA-directed RNA polymerase subunit E'/Rpb7
MFHKYLLRSTVALEPECLGPDTPTAIEQALERRYVDRVIHGKGLVALVLGVEKVGEGRIFHSDGGGGGVLRRGVERAGVLSRDG